jgi:hypothetical protein
MTGGQITAHKNLEKKIGRKKGLKSKRMRVRVCSTYGEVDRCIRGFEGKTLREEDHLETHALVRGLY